MRRKPSVSFGKEGEPCGSHVGDLAGGRKHVRALAGAGSFVEAVTRRDILLETLAVRGEALVGEVSLVRALYEVDNPF